jgi:hypothetical protein
MRTLLAGLFTALMVLQSTARAAEEDSEARKVATESFAALKEGRFDDYMEYVVPEDIELLSEYVREIVKLAEASEDPRAGQLVEVFGTAESLSELTPPQVAASYLEKSTKQIPGYAEMMAEAELDVLGELPDGDDKVVLLFRVLLPRAQVMVLEKRDDRWLTRLDSAQIERASLIKDGLSDRKQALEKQVAKEITAIHVIGMIKEDAAQQHVVFRQTSTIGEEETEIVNARPVGKTDPEWKLLGKSKRKNLETALLKKNQEELENVKQLAKALLQQLEKQPEPNE